MSTPEEVLALELINTIKSEMSPRAVTLEDRIENCLAYLDAVETPNLHTLNHARRCLTGEYDEFALTNPAVLLRGLFERQWYCEMFASGYDNSASCAETAPHKGRWSCRWLWVARHLSDAEAREFGLTTDIPEETTT